MGECGLKMRKICVVVASRANYGRVKPVLKAIDEHPNLELQLIVSASMLLERCGRASDVVAADGFKPLKQLYYILEGDEPIIQAKSTALGIIELSTAFDELKPDVVITVADRFETMATAIAASYMNIPLAHIQGGEITGNIDESVRHAITKLAHYHFPATEESRKRVLKMGEEEWRVLNTGCPSIDTLAGQNLEIMTDECKALLTQTGTGNKVKINSPYILISQHPVTTEIGQGYEQIMKTLEALKVFPQQKFVLWPNIDSGNDKVSNGIKKFKSENPELLYHYYKNFPPEIYNFILANALCVVGNSSSFIRECSWLGTPAVIVGNRQEGREHGRNVMHVNYEINKIRSAVKHQIQHGKYQRETIFGNGTAGKLIADYLADVNLNINKRMTY